MAKKNKLWFSGEDAQLAARFTKFMTKVLYARRASYTVSYTHLTLPTNSLV